MGLASVPEAGQRRDLMSPGPPCGVWRLSINPIGLVSPPYEILPPSSKAFLGNRRKAASQKLHRFGFEEITGFS